MKEILKISFGQSSDNFDHTMELNGQTVHIRGLGASHDLDLVLKLIERYRNEVDAIAISGFNLDIKLPKQTISHEALEKIRKAAGQLPILDGNLLRKAAYPWAIRRFLDQDKHLLANKTIAFYEGMVQWPFLTFFHDYNCRLVFGDLYSSLGIPAAIEGLDGLDLFLRLNAGIISRLKIKPGIKRDFSSFQANNRLMEKFHQADIFFITDSQLKYLRLNDLKGKTVIIDRPTKENHDLLFSAGAERIINLFPGSGEYPYLSSSTIEALLHVTQASSAITEEDILLYLQGMRIAPSETRFPQRSNQPERFAFIIHPLTKYQIAQIPGLEFLTKTPILDVAEKIASRMPGYFYCEINGIRSEANSKEVVGELYLLPATPKMLLTTPVSNVYDALVAICEKAHKNGAKIIGLGAYTKIVGDAGISVNQRSPIPVTTGNSLSAAATLWAASYGIDKMSLVARNDGRYQGTCMVVGATGSIGKICAKILSRHWQRLVVVAPRPYKVLELVEQLKIFSPNTEIIGTTNPNKYSSETDLIITSTSAQGEKILEIEKIKPGCVLCDVSRPFDIPLEDAAKRPDVLIIASGEVELPGNIKVEKTIGLQGETVYACLAETALLLMEGMLESFSLSRDLSYEKVVQIDRLSRKHGIKLSSIMGHTGEITEAEIAICRELALKNLKSQNY